MCQSLGLGSLLFFALFYIAPFVVALRPQRLGVGITEIEARSPIAAAEPAAGAGAAVCSLGPGEESHTVTSNDGSYWPYQNFQSAPLLKPPEFQFTKKAAYQQKLSTGIISITPSDFRTTKATKDVAPLIMTDSGQLVWNGPAANSTNLHVSTFKGKPILTYWKGLSTEGANVGHGYGSIVFLDTSYNEIVTVCPKVGIIAPGGVTPDCQADFHESLLTPQGTLIFSAYNATPADLSSIGGPKEGWVFDSMFFEVEPLSGKTLFSWSALAHADVSTTKQPLAGTGNASAPFDYFHINSVDLIPMSADGKTYDFLVNARHTWSTYHVPRKDGHVVGVLQGETGGDFGPLPPNGHFRWQHDARVRKVSKSSITLSYFNNYNSAVDNGTHPTNGLFLSLPVPHNRSNSPTVLTLLADAAEPLYADSQGSTDPMANGNFFMAYGQLPLLREYAPQIPGSVGDGAVLWEARYGGNSLTQGYRGFKQDWHATPAAPPALAVGSKGGASKTGCTFAYASWNGATDVESWAVYEGKTPDKLKLVGSVGYKGFETRFVVSGPYVQVAPVTSDGKTHKKSNVVQVS